MPTSSRQDSMPWERLNSLPCVPNKFIKGEKIVCERDVPLTLPPLHIYPTQGPCFPLLTPLLRSLLAPNTVIIIAYPPNWLFTLFSFLGLVLVILPLPWHLQGGSTSLAAPGILADSLERRHLRLHDLDRHWLLYYFHKLDSMERQVP